MHRVVVSAMIVLAVLACWTPTASADTTGSASTDRSGISEQVGVGVAAGEHKGGTAQHCVDVPLTDVRAGIASMPLPLGGVVQVKIDTPPDQPPGAWYAKWCGPAEFGGFFFVGRVNPIALADEARKRLPLPLPQPQLSPAGDQVVNLASWLWLGRPWAPLSSTVSVPGVSVTARAVPQQVVWTMGDGGRVVCDGPGTRYDSTVAAAAQSPSCAYTYSHSSASQPDLQYQGTVTVRWHATWSASGVAGGGDLGTIDRTTNFTVRVGEVQALNIDAR